MSNKINVQEILEKYGSFSLNSEQTTSIFTSTESRIKQAIKEIAELVVDECLDNAKMGADPEDLPGFAEKAILNIKQQINYE